MRPNKIGQVAKFHTPLTDENPNQLYVVLEIKEEVDSSRPDIKALNTGLSFPPSNTVLFNDEVVEVDTSDLVGHEVSINKADYSQVTGKVVKVSEQEIMLDITKSVKGVETNVWLTIENKDGNEFTGTLFVN
jgi:hypothetical protein